MKIPDEFLFSEESYEEISEEHELDPSNNNEAISDIDSRHWQEDMKFEIESMYSCPLQYISLRNLANEQRKHLVYPSSTYKHTFKWGHDLNRI